MNIAAAVIAAALLLLTAYIFIYNRSMEFSDSAEVLLNSFLPTKKRKQK